MFFSVFAVALLAEGVDRNKSKHIGMVQRQLSPSSRRAWIEISRKRPLLPRSIVALLAEGVDRNRYTVKTLLGTKVALLAEGVDRNIPARQLAILTQLGRPPRGGRG